jgi:hypothetical protein
MRYFLDTGPMLALAHLLKKRKVDLSSLQLLTLDACWEELGRVEASAVTRLDRVVEIVELSSESKASAVLYSRYRQLRTETTRDFGEHATIAYLAADDLDACFVTEERGAAWLSIVELGGNRTRTSLDLLALLRDRSLIDKHLFLDVSGQTHSEQVLIGNRRADTAGATLYIRPCERSKPLPN